MNILDIKDGFLIKTHGRGEFIYFIVANLLYRN